jgi:hypothetical protein
MDQRSRIIIRVGIALTCVIWVWYGGREKLNSSDCVALGVIAAMSLWEFKDRGAPL